MAKLVPLAVIAAVATLGACSTPPQAGAPSQAAPNIVTNVVPYTSGSGVVQSVSPTPVMPGAAAGSSQPLQRLEVKMDNGSTQYVDTASREITKGTRITLTEDKQIRRM
ncbi:MAG TPA: hypothetical protein VNP36_06600 [Burkholderiales bacterium]|nr:hypothetical protein [Burkholderiales bacterium]